MSRYVWIIAKGCLSQKSKGIARTKDPEPRVAAFLIIGSLICSKYLVWVYVTDEDPEWSDLEQVIEEPLPPLEDPLKVLKIEIDRVEAYNRPDGT